MGGLFSDSSRPAPDVFSMSFMGTEDEAIAAAVEELNRYEEETDPDVAPGGVSKVLTVWLWPRQAELDPERRNQQLIPVHFPWADPQALAAKMRREVDYLFSTDGDDGPSRLYGSLAFTLRAYEVGDGGIPFEDGVFENLVKFESPEQMREAGRLVAIACDDAARAVAKEAEARAGRTEAVAAALADAQLLEARTQIWAEATRYLSVAGEKADAARVLGSGVPENMLFLRGPDVAGLAGAIRRVADLQRAVMDATATHKAAVSGRATAAATRSLTPAQAAANVAVALEALQERVALEASTYPILYRIWRDMDLPAAVIVVPGLDGVPELTTRPVTRDPASRVSAEDVRIAGEALGLLRQAIVRTLRTAWMANTDFRSDLASRPAHVWRYQPLMARALQQEEVTDPSIAFRAAQDRVSAESGKTVIDTLNLVNAAMSTLAWLTSATPPVALVLATTGAILGLASTAQDFLKRLEQEHAHNAVLNPSLSIASLPGYVGIMVSIAFSVLDIKGVKDAAKVAGLYNRSAAAATALRLVAP